MAGGLSGGHCGAGCDAGISSGSQGDTTEALAAELESMRVQQAEFLRLRTQLERMQVTSCAAATPKRGGAIAIAVHCTDRQNRFSADHSTCSEGGPRIAYGSMKESRSMGWLYSCGYRTPHTSTFSAFTYGNHHCKADAHIWYDTLQRSLIE